MRAQTLFKSMPASLGRKLKLLGILILLVSTGFVWLATDQTIAPPIVRTMDLFWRLFVCQCFFQFDLLH
jgi:hypothetical protein